MERVEGIQEISAPSSQCRCEPEMALKNKVYFFKWGESNGLVFFF